MEFINQNIIDYALSHSDFESDLLQKVSRETHLKTTSPRMLSGHLQGRFLSLISKLIHPKYILEIGTFTGYSALCLAEGLHPEGKLITIDSNEETNSMANKYFQDSGFKNQMELMEGNALQIIPTLTETFDLIFIDADKTNYSNYFDLVIDKVQKGGVLIADNVLWSGKILDEKMDEDTLALHNFNQKIQNDTRIENILLPIRDGLMVMRKKS